MYTFIWMYINSESGKSQKSARDQNHCQKWPWSWLLRNSTRVWLHCMCTLSRKRTHIFSKVSFLGIFQWFSHIGIVVVSWHREIFYVTATIFSKINSIGILHSNLVVSCCCQNFGQSATASLDVQIHFKNVNTYFLKSQFYRDSCILIVVVSWCFENFYQSATALLDVHNRSNSDMRIHPHSGRISEKSAHFWIDYSTIIMWLRLRMFVVRISADILISPQKDHY